jgi:hypothetical protein
MNLSCVNEHIRVYADRSAFLMNIYVETTYNLTSIISFQQNCYFKLRNILSSFDYAIKGETCFEYFDILHIYAFLKSQVLSSYKEITIEETISQKFTNKILITTDEFIGLYVYSVKNNLIYTLYKVLLSEYEMKINFQYQLMNKVKFKQLMMDYQENQIDYVNNGLNKLLGNRELARYLSEFI